MMAASSPNSFRDGATAVLRLSAPSSNSSASAGDRSLLSRIASLGTMPEWSVAMALARNPMERRFLEQRVRACAALTPAPVNRAAAIE
jgi:hypothetical protein